MDVSPTRGERSRSHTVVEGGKYDSHHHISPSRCSPKQCSPATSPSSSPRLHRRLLTENYPYEQRARSDSQNSMSRIIQFEGQHDFCATLVCTQGSSFRLKSIWDFPIIFFKQYSPKGYLPDFCRPLSHKHVFQKDGIYRF